MFVDCSFSITLQSNKSSYIINKGSYQKLQCDNKEFSDIIESKEYVYTGCVVCFYDKKYVYRNDKNDKIELTDYARDHIEECCILFNDEGKYLIDVHVPIDSPKSFNRNFGYIKAKPVSFDLDTEGTDLDDATIKQIEEYNNTLNVLHKEEHKLFANTLIYHMNTKGKAGEPIDDKELAKRTHLSTTAIANICIGKTNKPNIKNVMALCIALSLDPEECYDMFQKAGYDIWEDTPRNRAYRYLCTCTMSGLTEANKILRVFRQEEVPDHKGQLS